LAGEAAKLNSPLLDCVQCSSCFHCYLSEIHLCLSLRLS